MQRLQHDVAWAVALHVLDVFELREEERHEAFPVIYQLIKVGLEEYQARVESETRRIKPSRN